MPMKPYKMTSMKRTPKRSIAEAKGMMPEAYPMEEQYPYGLKINLDHECLEKLGIDVGDYAVDEEVKIYAKAKVCEVSSREYTCPETGATKYDQRMEIQITDLYLCHCLDLETMGMDNPGGSKKHLRGLMGMMKY